MASLSTPAVWHVEKQIQVCKPMLYCGMDYDRYTLISDHSRSLMLANFGPWRVALNSSQSLMQTRTLQEIKQVAGMHA